MPTYICSENQSNKFWSFELKDGGTTVVVKYGRVGDAGQTDTKSFGSVGAAQRYVDGKVREKERKGYKLASKEKLAEEVDLASTIGTRNKIKRIEWVSRGNAHVLTLLDSYDPKQYVYVEVLNSWTKEVTRLLLSSSDECAIEGSIAESDRTIKCGIIRSVVSAEYKLVAGVRKLLRKMSQTVAAVFNTVKFGALGARSLFDEEGEAPEVSAALAAIDTSGFEVGVISRFAAMGSRALEL